MYLLQFFFPPDVTCKWHITCPSVNKQSKNDLLLFYIYYLSPHIYLMFVITRRKKKCSSKSPIIAFERGIGEGGMGGEGGGGWRPCAGVFTSLLSQPFIHRISRQRVEDLSPELLTPHSKSGSYTEALYCLCVHIRPLNLHLYDTHIYTHMFFHSALLGSA